MALGGGEVGVINGRQNSKFLEVLWQVWRIMVSSGLGSGGIVQGFSSGFN